MPVRRKDHHSQLSATPCSRTMLVTRFGVSVENVVATIETPTSHHGAARPDVKNSVVFLPARRKKKIAGRNEMTIDATTIPQSRPVSLIPTPPNSETRRRPREYTAAAGGSGYGRLNWIGRIPGPNR